MLFRSDAEVRGVRRAKESVNETKGVGADSDVGVEQREAADHEARWRRHGLRIERRRRA